MKRIRKEVRSINYIYQCSEGQLYLLTDILKKLNPKHELGYYSSDPRGLPIKSKIDICFLHSSEPLTGEHKVDVITQGSNIIGAANSIFIGKKILSITEKFFLFHLSSVFAITAVIFVTLFISGEPVISVTQLLILGLSLNVIGLFAFLQKDQEVEEVIQEVGRRQQVTWATTRNQLQILWQVIFQIIIAFILLWTPRSVGFWWRISTPRAIQKAEREALSYHALMLMPIFNSLSCGTLRKSQINIIKMIRDNSNYFIVMAFFTIAHLGLADSFGEFLQIKDLKATQVANCIVISFSVWVTGLVYKQIFKF